MLKGRSIYRGKAEGRVLKLQNALSFLGGVEASTGEIKVENGGNVADRILVFPRGKGSTVGSFVMYDLKAHGKSPLAIINSSAETIVATATTMENTMMTGPIQPITSSSLLNPNAKATKISTAISRLPT